MDASQPERHLTFRADGTGATSRPFHYQVDWTQHPYMMDVVYDDRDRERLFMRFDFPAVDQLRMQPGVDVSFGPRATLCRRVP